MATPFPFELVSPEKLLISGEAVSVSIPGSTGYFTMMANHAPVMSMLKTGTVEIAMADGNETTMFVQGGYADISSEGCTILAEFAAPIEEMNLEEIGQQIRNAEENVKDAREEIDKKKAAAELARLKETEIVVKHAKK